MDIHYFGFEKLFAAMAAQQRRQTQWTTSFAHCRCRSCSLNGGGFFNVSAFCVFTPLLMRIPNTTISLRPLARVPAAPLLAVPSRRSVFKGETRSVNSPQSSEVDAHIGRKLPLNIACDSKSGKTVDYFVEYFPQNETEFSAVSASIMALSIIAVVASLGDGSRFFFFFIECFVQKRTDSPDCGRLMLNDTDFLKQDFINLKNAHSIHEWICAAAVVSSRCFHRPPLSLRRRRRKSWRRTRRKRRRRRRRQRRRRQRRRNLPTCCRHSRA